MLLLPVLAAGAAAAIAAAGSAATPGGGDDPSWTRAQKLVAQMSLDEKMQFVQGTREGRGKNSGYVGYVEGVPRLSIPDLRMNDGPQGFRSPVDGTSTQWPSGLTVARSWNRTLVGEWGDAIGAEFHAKGSNVYFGPGLNVARIANGGRSFEYLSGEDPFLGHALVGHVVASVQAHKVVVNAKHLMDNNQEGFIPNGSSMQFGYGDRHSSSMNVAERVQMEIYFPPFAGAAEAGVGSFMCANNLINGDYACQNSAVQNGLLKNGSGFKGFICSDYDGTRSTYEAAHGGLDIAMPGPPTRPDYFGGFLRDAIENGTIATSVLDDKVTRIVYALAATGALDDPADPAQRNASSDVTSADHYALARRIAAESTVLLKNANGTLPLRVPGAAPLSAPSPSSPSSSLSLTSSPFRIGLIGTAATGLGAIYGGGGSGAVVPKSPVSIHAALTSDARLNVSYSDGSDPAEAAALAAAVDVAVVVLAQTSRESLDRTTLDLPQSDLVRVAAANVAGTPVVVVAVSPGPFLVAEWVDAAAAVLDMGFPGEQEGNALADVLLGAVNPSAKMPHTTPRKWNDVCMGPDQYPGTPPANGTRDPPACQDKPTPTAHFSACSPTETTYSEGLQVGYRWYDAHSVEPAFPFGHGLSYTSFAYSDLEVDAGARTVSATVTNSGPVAGAEVAQLYLRFPEAVGEPFRQLRGFEKVHLEPNASARVTFALSPDRWLSVWDEATHAWTLARGDHDVLVGSSSADIRLRGKLSV